MYKNLAPRATMVVKESTARSMRSNRSTDNRLEVNFRKALWSSGLRGYRKNVRKLPGCPDVVFGKSGVAVFVHGCYWHRCPKCQKDAPLKTNEAYWRSKLAANVERDAISEERLRALGFYVVVIWECEIRRDIQEAVSRVRDAIGAQQDLIDSDPSDNMSCPESNLNRATSV
jgi:DNA mismatch endonuclease (patch repair protein)